MSWTRVHSVGLAVSLLLTAVLLQTRQGSAGDVSSSGQAVTPDAATTLNPMQLNAGQYRYSVQELGGEAIDDAGNVLVAAELQAAVVYELQFDSSTSWVETSSTEASQEERSFDGQNFETTVTGLPVERETIDPGSSESVYNSSFPHGGPRIELNPYGGHFLVQFETAQNDASESSGAATIVETDDDCAARVCRIVEFERPIPRPNEESAYYRSLPWAEDNVERTTLVYEVDSGLVHLYRTTLNGETTHLFELLDRP